MTSPKALPAQQPFSFDGSTYEPALDRRRLTGQLLRVWEVVRNGQWYTLAGLEILTGDPQASISSRLRDLRKPRFGGYVVERRRVLGTHEYRVLREEGVHS